jgi:hypothetical protein
MENLAPPTIPPVQQPLPQAPIPVPTTINWSKILAFAILGLIVITGSVYIGIQIGKGQTQNQQSISTQPTVTTNTTAASPTELPINSDITANWKTYVNAALWFSLKYPTTVQIEKELNDQYNRTTIFRSVDMHFEVMLRNNSNKVALDKYLYMDSPVKRTATLAGKEANVYEFPKGYCDGPSCSDPFVAIVIENANDFYHLSFFGSNQLSNLDKQILSSFKLINGSEPTKTTSTKIYSDINYPFEVEYPANWYLRTTYGKSVNNLGNSRIAGIDISNSLTYGSTVVINVIDPKTVEFNEWIKLYSGRSDVPAQPNTKYNNYPAFRFTYSREGKPDLIEIYYLYKDKIIYIAQNTASISDEAAVNQIVNSLRIVN